MEVPDPSTVSRNEGMFTAILHGLSELWAFSVFSVFETDVPCGEEESDEELRPLT
jgi:hypothetical protein